MIVLIILEQINCFCLIFWAKKSRGFVYTDDETPAKYRLMTKYNIQGFEGLLTITSLEPEDSGIYSCVSIQEHPQAEDCSHTKIFNITLNVNCKYCNITKIGLENKIRWCYWGNYCLLNGLFTSTKSLLDLKECYPGLLLV